MVNIHNHTNEIETMPDWSKWENHVLAELKRLNGNIEKAIADQGELTQKYFDLKEQLTVIKTKVAFFGALFGFGGSLVVPLFQMIINFVGKH